jgi:hypothetical protein
MRTRLTIHAVLAFGTCPIGTDAQIVASLLDRVAAGSPAPAQRARAAPDLLTIRYGQLVKFTLLLVRAPRIGLSRRLTQRPD